MLICSLHPYVKRKLETLHIIQMNYNQNTRFISLMRKLIFAQILLSKISEIVHIVLISYFVMGQFL